MIKLFGRDRLQFRSIVDSHHADFAIFLFAFPSHNVYRLIFSLTESHGSERIFFSLSFFALKISNKGLKKEKQLESKNQGKKRRHGVIWRKADNRTRKKGKMSFTFFTTSLQALKSFQNLSALSLFGMKKYFGVKGWGKSTVGCNAARIFGSDLKNVSQAMKWIRCAVKLWQQKKRKIKRLKRFIRFGLSD